MEPDIIHDSLKKENYEDIDFGSNFIRLKANDNVRELQTVLRDRSTSRSDFVFYADRLIRLVVEEGLNQLPYRECQVTTPTGEAMEQSVRDCCRSIRIGKILIHSDEDTHDARVVYSKLPPDIANRKVLLLYPIGNLTILTSEVHPVAPNHFGQKYFGTA
ncbi:UPP-like protein [Mya arenaria]|uniref:UPP-like protein n=1 Tax=Mya arenaria TaxID=6604 RepID=A0ABY7ENY3_MYAAR|nr:UPP-like protein [Mya arenaria]